MAGPIVIKVLAETADAERGASRVGSAFRKTGSVVAKAAGAGAVGLGLLAVASVKSASSSQQSLGATETVFKRYADTVIDRSNRAANAVGLSANEYRELNNVLGASLTGAGISIKKTTALTGDLTKRASDMAATFGGTTREAIESISSALRGETDPIERYGVSLKASDVSARLAAKGLDKLTGEAKKQAEMQTRLELLFTKTKTSQGAFRRESNTLAGQQQRLGASFENIKAKIGTALLPALTSVTKTLNRDVVPPVMAAADKYLPRLSDAIADLFKGGGGGDGLTKIREALDGIDWDEAEDGARAIFSSLKKIGGAVGAAGLDTLASGVKVTGTVLEFAAKHSDKLAAALPFLAAGFVAIKVAQAAANVAMAAAIPLRFAELAATRQQTIAIRAMTAAVAQLTAAQAGAARGAFVNGTWYSAVRNNGAAAATTTTQVSRLGTAAKVAGGAAGVGFLAVGLSQAAREGNSFSSVLSSAAGGAGIGAMFGPIGALVGAGAGAGLGALIGAFSGTKDEAKKTAAELQRTEGYANAKRAADSLRESLVGVITAYGNTSRAAIEASFTGEDGKLDSDIAKLREYGVSMSTIVSATLGQADAQRQVDSAFETYISQQEASLPRLKSSYEDVRDGMRDLVTATGQVIANGARVDTETIDNYKKAYDDARAAVENAGVMQDNFGRRVSATATTVRDYQRQVQKLAGELGVTVKQYRQFPKKVRTDFEENGLRQTRADALKLIREYKGLQSFRRIRSVISAPGVDLTRRDIRELQRAYKLTPKQVRTLMRVEGVAGAVRESGKVKKALTDTDKARPDLGNYSRGVRDQLGRTKKDAERGAKDVADKLEAGPRGAKADLGPFRGDLERGVSSAKGSAASGGQGIGASLGDGVVYGIASRSGAVQGAIASSVRNAIAAGRREAQIKSPSRKTFYIGSMMGKGLVGGLEAAKGAATTAAGRLVAQIIAGITRGAKGGAKATAALDKLISSTLKKRIKDATKLRNATAEVTKAIDAELAKVRRAAGVYAKAKKAREDYTAAAKRGALDFANITGVGQVGDAGEQTAASITQGLRDRLNAIRNFTTKVAALRKANLRRDLLDQIIKAGVEGGTATAEALVAGGSAAVREANSIQAQIAAAAANLGTTATNSILDPLDPKKVERAATRAANAIARILKERVGVNIRVETRTATRTPVVRRTPVQRTAIDRRALADKQAAASDVRVFGQLELTAEQLSAVERGRRVTVDLKAYRRAGGRLP